MLLVSGIGLSNAYAQTLCYYDDQPETDPANCPDPNWTYADYASKAPDCVLGGPRPGGLDPVTDLLPSGERCDDYDVDRYERPTSQSGNDYFAEYDIVESALGGGATWFYYAIKMFDVNQNGDLDGKYGYEIDFDDDERGDFYVKVINPTFPQIEQYWTQKDVFMWNDSDEDVGGSFPQIPNDKLPTQNGYDVEFFKLGEKIPDGPTFPYNNDPPYGGPNIYARISPSDPRIVEIAIRQSFVGNPSTAGNLRGWATKGNQAAGQFYFNDWYNNAQIGDAYSDEPHYPPQNFYEGDNSNGIGEGHLPVELTSFDVQLNGHEAHLTWETASETNNAGFFVEMDAGSTGSFKELAFVEGRGTTEFAQSYAYRVEDLAPGRHGFRLKQIDFDGTFAYHPEVEVVVEMAERFVVEPVYPNPFNPQAQFRFAVQRAQPVRVELYDLLGRRAKVLYKGVAVAGQMQVVRIDGSDLPSGMYVVRVSGVSFVKAQTVTLLK